MHLAGEASKSEIFLLRRLDGGEVETSLRYSDTRALVSRHPQPLGGEASACAERA
jgi:hypothetical protein